MDLPILTFIKLAKMADVMHEADHAYSIQSTWWLHRLATDVPFIAYVINLPCTFIHYLELSNFQFYFMIWIVVFQNFNHLSPVRIFCECCRMSLLWFTYYGSKLPISSCTWLTLYTFLLRHPVLSITFIILSAIFIILSPILFVISDIYNGFYRQTNLS